ncbi:MAG: hypothetical protein EA398_12725 [Deltaproteobacteria bacterium]|nr:MAG: hypothetical protein EA398_12725 [Deltaproteobacteria bacterium]
MIRHPLRYLAAAADLPRAHPIYHRAVRRALDTGRLTASVRAELRSDLPYMSALTFTPEMLGFDSLDAAAAAIAAGDERMRGTNHVDRERGLIIQAPFVEEGAHVDSRAELTGGIHVSRGVFIAPEAIVRMDEKSGLAPMVIGPESNIQDEALVHADHVAIGARCIVAHDAVVHGAKLADDVTVYIKAIVDTGAVVGPGTFLDAAAYVGRGVTIPPERYVAPMTAVTSDEIARSLPPIDDGHRRMRADVLAHNAEHAQRYVRGQFDALAEILDLA